MQSIIAVSTGLRCFERKLSTFTWIRCTFEISRFLVRNDLAAKLVERAFVDPVARLAHQIEIKMQIVQRDQAQPENFLGFNQMADVTATEFTATGAVAIVFDRPLIPRKLRVFQIERAGRSERGAISRESRWQYTIEHIHPARYHFQQLRWGAEPHSVTRLVTWQKRLTRFDRANHLFLRLADADAADGIAVEIKVDNRLRASLTQFVKRRALYDSED